jgi:single-strand DNA-binding protein
VVAWQKLAESCAAKLKKGSAVYIEGELRSRTMDHEDGSRHSLVEIRAHHIQFLDKLERVDDREFAENDDFIEDSDQSI